MLKSFLLFTAVVLLVTAAASAPARPPQESGASKKANPEQLAKAKKVYKLDCALCHGETGDGKTDIAKDMQLTLDNWTDSKTLASLSDEALIDVIRKGKGKMPPEDSGRATNDEVRGLVVYIRNLAKEQAAPAAAQPAAAPVPTPAATPATPAPATSPSK